MPLNVRTFPLAEQFGSATHVGVPFVTPVINVPAVHETLPELTPGVQEKVEPLKVRTDPLAVQFGTASQVGRPLSNPFMTDPAGQ